MSVTLFLSRLLGMKLPRGDRTQEAVHLSNYSSLELFLPFLCCLLSAIWGALNESLMRAQQSKVRVKKIGTKLCHQRIGQASHMCIMDYMETWFNWYSLLVWNFFNFTYLWFWNYLSSSGWIPSPQIQSVTIDVIGMKRVCRAESLIGSKEGRRPTCSRRRRHSGELIVLIMGLPPAMVADRDDRWTILMIRNWFPLMT